MFKPNKSYEVDRRFLKCDYNRYSPPETSTKNTPKSQIYINIPIENSVPSLWNIYLGLNFEVIKKAGISRYENGNDIRLNYVGPIALFNNFEFTTSSGKQLEDMSHAYIVPLMYKPITSNKDSDDLSKRFDRSRNRRKDELTQNKNIKGNYHLRILFRDTFGFAEHQEKATYGIGYKLALTRNKDDAVIDKAAGSAEARTKIDYIHWYVPHYTPSTQQQGILSEQILNKTPTELQYIERYVFMKEVNNQNLSKFESGSQEHMNVPIWIIIGFQQRALQDSQSLNNGTFCRLSVISAQTNIGNEKYLDAGILLNYDDDDCSQGYTQIEEIFRALTKDDILQPFISDNDNRSSNVRADDVGYNIYVFDIRYQQNFKASQPINLEFKIDGVSFVRIKTDMLWFQRIYLFL